MGQAPSFIIAIWTFYATKLQGDKKRSGWMWAFLSEFLWVSYGLLDHQLGFILMAIPFGFINFSNWLKWGR